MKARLNRPKKTPLLFENPSTKRNKSVSDPSGLPVWPLTSVKNVMERKVRNEQLPLKKCRHDAVSYLYSYMLNYLHSFNDFF